MKKKRWLIILFVFVLFLTAYEISTSFSLFETNRDTVVNNDIGRWQVKVNDDAINETTTFNITNFVVDSDSNVRENYFAPGTDGYFDIEIDPNNTDVSVYFEIVCRSDLILNDNISLTDIEDVGREDLILVAPYTYAGVITRDESEDGDVITIRFYISWENQENNNAVDSLYGSSSEAFEIPMEITFKQYMGEQIVEYDEGD